MSDTCPTIKIIRDDVEVVINLFDYDPEKHVIAGQEQVKSEAPTAFEDMTATQLKEYAAENDIDVTGLRSKADLLAAVEPTEPTEPTDGE